LNRGILKLIGLWLFYSISVGATEPLRVQLDQRVPYGNGVGVGSRLMLQNEGRTTSGVFLGRLIDPKGKTDQFMILDETRATIYFAERAHLELPRTSYQPILKPYDQVGGTCTGYAINHYLQQMYWSGHQGNGSLQEQLSTEKGRTQLLVQAINEYYLVLQHRYSLVGVMNKMSNPFGFKCKSKTFTDAFTAIQFIQKELLSGNPLVFSFSIGPNMVNAPVELIKYGSIQESLDHRLWVPRKKGQRNSGGHSIVAAGIFSFRSRPFLLMLDSDWAEPRVWDLQEYLNDQTAIDELELISCH
jgi:hypothetical protein